MKLWKVEHEPGIAHEIQAETVHDAANIWLERKLTESDKRIAHRYYLRIVQMEPALDADGHSPMAQFLSVIAEPICRIHSVMGYHGWPKPPDRERSTLILERTPFLK